MKKTEKIIRAIARIEIQGASNIAKAFLATVVSQAKNDFSRRRLIQEIKILTAKIIRARPTEPLVLNFSRLLVGALENFKGPEKDRAGFLKSKTREIYEFYETREKAIAYQGAKLIKSKENIFTHCHSLAVESILTRAKKQGRNFKVYNTETRPVFQGRLTAKNLAREGLKITLVPDSAGAFLVSDNSGDEIKINKVIFGADVIGLDGSAVNKIGSFGLALAAWESKIPVYIAASLLKVDVKSEKGIKIPLEKREAEEVWPKVPHKNIKIINYAFDYIPARFITGFITEIGLIKPTQVARKVKKEYPCLF